VAVDCELFLRHLARELLDWLRAGLNRNTRPFTGVLSKAKASLFLIPLFWCLTRYSLLLSLRPQLFCLTSLAGLYSLRTLPRDLFLG
jgi:hypothetical protein